MSTELERTDIRCVVCKTSTIVKETRTFLPSSPDIPFGPGAEAYRRVTIEFYCPRCGIQYRHLPKSAATRKAAIRKRA